MQLKVQVHKKAVFLLFSPTILSVLLILLLRHLFKTVCKLIFGWDVGFLGQRRFLHETGL